MTDEVGTTTAADIVSAAPKTPAVAELEKKIAELGAEYTAAYGDGSNSTVAAEIAAEIAQANTYVDAVVGITGKTRSAVENEINPQ